MRLSFRLLVPFCLAFCLANGTPSCGDEDASTAAKEAKRVALSQLNPLIGQWRGVGRVQRNKTDGTWREKADWVWGFEDDGPSFKYTVTDGNELKAADISWDVSNERFSPTS